MLTDAFDILTLPGWQNSGPDNWQSHCSEKLGLWPQGLVLFGRFLADLA
ncbi:hypothetical protein G3N57_10815 [Paraburkholderia sp. Se-20369]|nr:hypothetical protein [Paraburkholderia sp. Se-20369]